ncbi:MAG TPA: thioredoxin family protein [Syntrophales bacterium]|nr:thioredoxin family protein [Syntrophales bacterium]
MKKLQIFGPGCAKCKKLAEDAEKAAKDLGLEYEIEKITDVREMVKFGVLTTPALGVNGKVKSAGKILDPEKIKILISEE